MESTSPISAAEELTHSKQGRHYKESLWTWMDDICELTEKAYREEVEDRIALESYENMKEATSDKEHGFKVVRNMLEDQLNEKMDEIYHATGLLGREIDSMAANAYADGLNIDEAYEFAFSLAKFKLATRPKRPEPGNSPVKAVYAGSERDKEFVNEKLENIRSNYEEISDRTCLQEEAMNHAVNETKKAMVGILNEVSAPQPEEISEGISTIKSN